MELTNTTKQQKNNDFFAYLGRTRYFSSVINELNIVGNDMKDVKKHAERLVEQKNPSPSRMFVADRKLNALIGAFEVLMADLKYAGRFVVKNELFDLVKSCGVKVYKSWTKKKMIQALIDTKVAYING